MKLNLSVLATKSTGSYGRYLSGWFAQNSELQESELDEMWVMYEQKNASSALIYGCAIDHNSGRKF